MEEAREGITLSVLRLGCQWSFRSVLFLVARLCSFPSSHRVRLRRKECGGLRRKAEGGLLIVYNDVCAVGHLAKLVAEGDVVIGYTELYNNGQLLVVGVGNAHLVGFIVYKRSLGRTHGVAVLHLTVVHRLVYKVLAEVANIGNNAQQRRLHHLLAIVCNVIEKSTGVVFNIYNKQAIRRRHFVLLGKGTAGGANEEQSSKRIT